MYLPHGDGPDMCSDVSFEITQAPKRHCGHLLNFGKLPIVKFGAWSSSGSLAIGIIRAFSDAIVAVDTELNLVLLAKSSEFWTPYLLLTDALDST